MQDEDPGAAEMLARHLENFATLSPEEIAAIEATLALPVRSGSARRDLIVEGAPPRAVFLIVSGWACRFKTLEDGRRQIVGFLLPGDVCDLNNVLLARMDHSIGALTEVRYVEISNTALQRLSLEHPRVGQALSWQMLVTLSTQREWTMNIGQRNALERLGSLFCELSLRLQAVGLATPLGYDFPLTQTDLADATGLTSVHVNRTLQHLRAAGLISLSSRVLRIPDYAALEDASLFTPEYLHLDQRDTRRGHNLPGGVFPGGLAGR
ncbi:Crp/Fnr family transcriptional regulator [Sphingomonas sp. ac-8]|uniref:Crp/Fnr family transcriptional regulator n=1 Tax=Sphingomonas sp. ac-8 TaxID=3242977 RepID=UPI003A813273